MNNSAVTQILSEAPLNDLLGWQSRIEQDGIVHDIKDPELGLVMMRGRESVERQVFNFGEVLVSECSVSLDGDLGYGIVTGNQPKRVKAMAVIDVVIHSSAEKWTAVKQQMQDWLEQESKQQLLQRKKEHQLVESTKVNFDVMDED